MGYAGYYAPNSYIFSTFNRHPGKALPSFTYAIFTSGYLLKGRTPMTSTEAMIYQLKKLKGKPLKQKVEHIVTYFWLPIAITLVITISVGSYIAHLVTMKDVALSVICLNADPGGEAANTLATKFAEDVGISLNDYEVYISTDLILDDTDLMNAYNVGQIVMTQIVTNSVDLLIGDLNATTRYFYQEVYFDLNEILSEEQRIQYAEYFLYADMALVRRLQEEPMTTLQYPDPTKPEEMEDPMPVALLIPSNSSFIAACYPSQKSGIAVGIVASTEKVDTALAFLDYIFSKE